MINLLQKSTSLKLTVITICASVIISSSLSAQTNIDSLENALSKIVETDDNYLNTLSKVTDYYAYNRLEKEARAYIAKTQLHANNRKSEQAQKNVYVGMATLMTRLNKIDSALHYQNLEFDNIGNDSFEMARVYLNMSNSFLKIVNADSMEYYTSKALGIFNRNTPDSLRRIADCLGKLGIVNDIRENNDVSIKYYMNALKIWEQLGDKRRMGKLNGYMAMIYQKAGNLEQALYHEKIALNFARETKDEDLVSNALHSLGSTYKNLNEHKLSEQHLLESLEIRKRRKDDYYACYTLYVLGSLYRDMKDYDASIDFYDQAIALCQLINNEYTLGNVYINKARTLMVQNHFNQANIVLDSALMITEKLNIVSSKKYVYDFKAEVEEELGNYEVAYQYLKKYHIIEDSIQQSRMSKDIQDLQLKYESEANRAIINQQELKLVKSSNHKNLLGLGLLGFAFFTFSLFRRYKRKQSLQNDKIISLKREQKLLAIDSMLEGQQEERKRIAQDLHDGLGGLLTSVRLQVKKVQQEVQKLEEYPLLESAEKLINNACDEVRRIAHDMMPDALVNLGFVDAVEDLATSIQQTGKLKVQIHFSDPEMTLTDKQSIMMYRIIQEASNNTLKYASANVFTIQCISEADHHFFTIEDDGIGMDVIKVNKGKGVENIKSRVQYLEGEMNINSDSDGLSYEIKIPR